MNKPVVKKSRMRKEGVNKASQSGNREKWGIEGRTSGLNMRTPSRFNVYRVVTHTRGLS